MLKIVIPSNPFGTDSLTDYKSSQTPHSPHQKYMQSAQLATFDQTLHLRPHHINSENYNFNLKLGQLLYLIVNLLGKIVTTSFG